MTHIVSVHNNQGMPRIEPALLYYRSNKVSMDSSETPAEKIQPLQVSIETIANLIYLARRAETHSAQQHRYLDWAADVIKELKYHPQLNE
jgi:hypothetical protein